MVTVLVLVDSSSSSSGGVGGGGGNSSSISLSQILFIIVATLWKIGNTDKLNELPCSSE